MRNVLAVDIGGTNVRFGLVDRQGGRLSLSSYRMPPGQGPDGFIADLAARLQALLRLTPASQMPIGLGVGAPGRVLPGPGVVEEAINLPGWKNVELKKELTRLLGLETRVENDANLHALGEWKAGAGQGFNDLAVLTLGTGVGGGLVLGGRLWTPARGSAAELGHMVVEKDGPPCACGGRGCLEVYASATGMVRLALELAAAGQPTGCQRPLGELTASHLFDLACEQDPLAREAFELAGSYLGAGLASLFNILGLEAAVIGGGAAASHQFFEPAMERELKKRLFTLRRDQITIRRGQLDDGAGLAGAAFLFGQ